MRWTRTRARVALGAVVVGLAIGLILRDGLLQLAGTDETRINTTPTVPAADPEYSLTITAQRERSYPGSTIRTVREPALRDGYYVGAISFYADGLKEFAQITLPATPRPMLGYPVVILVHGYIQPTTYRMDEPQYTRLSAELARRGFLVIKPDLRGHGQSWGVPEGAYFSSGYVSDVINLAASLPGYSLADPSRVALVGHSMGAQVALKAAIVEPDRFRAVVLAAGAVGTLDDMYRNWSAYSDHGDAVTLGYRKRVVALFGEPRPDNAFWQSVDPYNYLADLRASTLLLHARDDRAVPLRFSQELSEAMGAAGNPAEFITYPTGGHSLDGIIRLAFLEKVGLWLEEKLR